MQSSKEVNLFLEYWIANVGNMIPFAIFIAFLRHRPSVHDASPFIYKGLHRALNL